MQHPRGCITERGSALRSLENSWSCMADVSGWRAPSAKEAVSSSPSPTSTSDAPRLPYVLLVEDNEGASGALRVLFETTGHRVTVAATVSEAVRVIRETHPDLVLLDLTLPDG